LSFLSVCVRLSVCLSVWSGLVWSGLVRLSVCLSGPSSVLSVSSCTSHPAAVRDDARRFLSSISLTGGPSSNDMVSARAPSNDSDDDANSDVRCLSIRLSMCVRVCLLVSLTGGPSSNDMVSARAPPNDSNDDANSDVRCLPFVCAC
jgi:hypothetical protein